MEAPSRIGDRLTSDVVVRIRTKDGRDDWIYCHSQVLEKSKYFADRLSENWPTCQILDSRNCVEVYCEESDFNFHVSVLRLLYVIIDGSVYDLWNGVRNALGILKVAFDLGCTEIITACVNYLEAVPWEETEEDEILKTIPGMGPQVETILARLQPVNPSAIKEIFLSTLRFATSSPLLVLNDLKSSAQEQLEYMLSEDDDDPLIAADDKIKYEVRNCMNKLFSRFNNLLECLLCEPTKSNLGPEEMLLFQSYVSDLLWASQVLTKLEIMREFVNSWVDASPKVVEIVEQASPSAELLKQKFKVLEVAAKALEAVGYGTVILPTSKRINMVKLWLPFVRVTKHLIDSITIDGEDTLDLKMDDELWQSLESTFVSIILALPSDDQADILTEWLENKNIRYPDLTEAFEVWCYRSKVSKRKLSLLLESQEGPKPFDKT